MPVIISGIKYYYVGDIVKKFSRHTRPVKKRTVEQQIENCYLKAHRIGEKPPGTYIIEEADFLAYTPPKRGRPALKK